MRMCNGNLCMLSFDLEDWFQVENLKAAIRKEEWDSKELRVVKNTYRILDILDSYGAKATFFVLGWIAEKTPYLIREIHKRGHENASHGYAHELIYDQSPDEFRKDIRRSKSFLEDCIGEPIWGYRAPAFSITEWAIDILKEEGFLYDSSYFPVLYHDRYGKIDCQNSHRINNTIKIRENFYELMFSSLDIMRMKIPWSGGGYFRFIPYAIYCWGVKQIIKSQGNFMFYLHPWEIDTSQPRVTHIKWHHKIRHYGFIKGTEKKLKRSLAMFHFDSIKNVLIAEQLI